MKIKGKGVLTGDNIDTDIVIPGRYLVLQDPKELAKHAMEGIDANFPKKVEKGALLVAGKNFGCGSSREEAPVALKYAGVKCVIAQSFARIFYRNSINVGLPVLETKDARLIDEGDELEVDVEKGTIKDLTKGIEIKASPLPAFIMEIIKDGGLVEHLRKKLGTNA